MKPGRSAAALALRAAEIAGVFALLERGEAGRRDVLRVLTYHRVADPADRTLYPGLVSASPVAFELQMRWLSARYRFVSMQEVLECRRRREPLPPRALLLTFDDAYADFAQHAWPTLDKLGLPATVFVPTGFPDQPGRVFWWDRLFRIIERTRASAWEGSPLGRLELRDARQRAGAHRRLRGLLRSLPHDDAMALVDDAARELGEPETRGAVLGWDTLRSLARRGVTLCSHTQSHPALDRLPEDRIRREVAGSLVDLQREIGSVLPVFAYPEGRFGAEALRALAAEGIELAFTTRRGLDVLSRADPLLLRRVPVTPRATRPVLRAQLLGWTARSSPARDPASAQ